jgi:hypothetical protein
MIDPEALAPSGVLHLQRSMGNTAVTRLLDMEGRSPTVRPNPSPEASRPQAAVVQRRLEIDAEPISASRITRQSAYKRRLNSIISEEAAEVGLAPNAVRQELVRMTTTGTHDFDTIREAVLDAISRLIMTLPVAKLPVQGLVRRALAGLSGDKLSQATILERLKASFGGDEARLHQATRRPEFAEALLEQVRTKQSKNWVKATEIHQVKPTPWTSQELQRWNVRHYTSKLMVVLGPASDGGTFAVQDVEPPTFTELLSSITLATKAGRGDTTGPEPRQGDRVMMSFTSGAATSGHTTGVDWGHIGNVGDTFYGLFYGDEPATGVTPNFIRDAVYYATWPVSEFGTAWASTDWLGTAASSQIEGAKAPEGKARQGKLADVIADIFPAAATRNFSATAGQETPESRSERTGAFNAMPNFEVKKHGPMPVRRWLPVDANIQTIKKWHVDAKTGKFVKLDTEVKSNPVDTPEWALLKKARGLGLLQITPKGRDEIYSFAGVPYVGEQGFATALEDPALFARVKEAIEADEARRAEADRLVKLEGRNSAPPPPPGSPGTRGAKKLVGAGVTQKKD